MTATNAFPTVVPLAERRFAPVAANAERVS